MYGMECSDTGCGFSLQDGVLKKGQGINIQDELLVYRMGCYFPGWGVSIRDGVLVCVGCKRNAVLVYRMGC